MSTNGDIATAVRLFGTAVGLVVGAVATPIAGAAVTLAANIGASAIESSGSSGSISVRSAPLTSTTGSRFITSPDQATTPVPSRSSATAPQSASLGSVTVNINQAGVPSKPQSQVVSGNGGSIVTGFEQTLSSFASILGKSLAGSESNVKKAATNSASYLDKDMAVIKDVDSDNNAVIGSGTHLNDDGSGYYDTSAQNVPMIKTTPDTSTSNSDIGGFDPFAPEISVGSIDI